MHSQTRSLPYCSLLIASGVLHHIARSQFLSVTVIGILGFGASAMVAFLVGISEPMFHDEFSYLLAADTFAHGRLTNPTHPLWMHFESFHIIQQPSYMSKYPPAQGLVLAIGQIIGGHPIVGTWMSFGLMCAAICWMLHGWMPPRWALLGGILALINPMLGVGSYWAQSYWGGAVAATGGALLLGGVRRLMRRARVSDALLTGVGLAILANSRPYEGLLVSVPIWAILLRWMMNKRGPEMCLSIRQIVLPILIVLSLTSTAMGLYNLRVTGHPLQLPYQVHEKTYAVVPLFIWQDLRPEPVYHHQPIRDFHVSYISYYDAQRSISGFLEKNIAFIRGFARYYLNVFAIPLVAVLWLLMHWALRYRWGHLALIVYSLLIASLQMQTYTSPHYVAPITGLHYFSVLSAMRLWRWRNKRIGQFMLWLVPCLAITALMGSVLYDTIKRDDSSAWYFQRARLLAQLNQQQSQHVVIVRYGLQHFVDHEWVYNEAEIDRAKVIWARDMNPARNCKLIEYFKDRRIWLLEVDMDEPGPKLKPYPIDLCRRL
jgi:hypothetical protein